jgi:Fe-S-cluster containining protein
VEEPSSKDDRVREASALCLDCGMCCQGALHDKIDIAENEVDLAAAGGGVERTADRLFTPLPCPYLDGAACTVYAKRYASCREYQCALLKTFHRGEVSAERARELVAEAKRLLADLRAVLPEGQSLREARAKWRNRSTEWSNASEEERATNAAIHLRMTMVQMFLDRHFRLSREGESVTRR